MNLNPYKSQPDYAFWRDAICEIAADDIDPVVDCPFKITPYEKIVTAGSCFAQHISRYLQANNFNYFVAEPPHPIIPNFLIYKYNYSIYSARFGNIYTSRQLLQLYLRAFGEFQPNEDIWHDHLGRFIDPFRPRIQPGGFSTEREIRADCLQHLAKVRHMFSQLDIFIFTLGLTECWASKEDGAVYPLCPGVAGGTFDSKKYHFLNLGVNEVVNEMIEFFERLASLNPAAKMLLTVSPVPLIATAENRHVLTATTYSKSVLRVASEILSNRYPDRIAYFPAYEIITGNFSRGRYFAKDLRSVNETGVKHVMRTFFKNYGGLSFSSQEDRLLGPESGDDEHVKEMAALVKADCDEELLDSGRHSTCENHIIGNIKEISFQDKFLPDFIFSATGLSVNEQWGRWSDTAKGEGVIIKFSDYLPLNFKIEIVAIAYGPNINKPVYINVGSFTKFFSFNSNNISTFSLIFQHVERIDTIEIIPPEPVRPKDFEKENLDERLIGLGFISLKIIPFKK